MQQAGYSDSADKQFTTRAAKFSISLQPGCTVPFHVFTLSAQHHQTPLGDQISSSFSYKWNICSGPIMLFQYLSTCSVLENTCSANIPPPSQPYTSTCLLLYPLFLLCPHPTSITSSILPHLPSSMSGPSHSHLPPSFSSLTLLFKIGLCVHLLQESFQTQVEATEFFLGKLRHRGAISTTIQGCSPNSLPLYPEYLPPTSTRRSTEAPQTC